MTKTYRFRPPHIAAHSQRAFWLRDAGYDTLDDVTPLVAPTSADVAIIGGGLTGMWTAYRLLRDAPELDVVIVDADICGSGASGRNGGQVHSWFESIDRLTKVTGSEHEALRLAQATSEAVDELRELQESGEIDMGLRLDGWLWTASSKAQEGAWDETIATCSRLGVTPYRALDADEIHRRTGSAASYVGVAEDKAGTLHPGKLCLGLRALLKREGVRIYERTPVTRLHVDEENVCETPGGVIRADQVLIATNAWASSIPELARHIYTVESEVIVTEPIPERLDAMGWTDGASICDSQRQVLYYQRTLDGRVQLGRGSGGLVYGDRIGPRQNQNPDELEDSLAELVRLWPDLADVRIDFDWTGAIDCIATHVPLIGRLNGTDSIWYCVGWNGTALAQIPVVSRILASSIRGADDEWSKSGLASPMVKKVLPPEPIRWIGGKIVRAAVARMNAAEIGGGRAGLLTRLLVRLMPSAD